MSEKPKLRGTLLGRLGDDATVYADPELSEDEKQAWRDAFGVEKGEGFRFSRILTADEMRDLNQYLVKKWGI